MKLRLKVSDESDQERILDFRQEFLDNHHEHHIPGAHALAITDSYEQWLKHITRVRSHPHEDEVSATQYIAIDDTSDRVIGVIQLRHRLNEHLRKEGGHIGYSIRPSQRRKGYGVEMLKLCLYEAKRLGLDSVLLTCDEDNVASATVIERCGGRFENTRATSEGKTKRRYWINL